MPLLLGAVGWNNLIPVSSEEAFGHTNGLLCDSMLDPTDASLGHIQLLVQELSSGWENGTPGSKGYTFDGHSVEDLVRESLLGFLEKVRFMRSILPHLLILRPSHGLPRGLIWDSPVYHIECVAAGSAIEPVWLVDVSIQLLIG